MHSTLDVVRTQMQEAEPILKRLDEELEAIKFDPTVPSSVDAATEKVTAIIDTLLASFEANPILGPLAAELKYQYLDAIQHQVAPVQKE